VRQLHLSFNIWCFVILGDTQQAGGDHWRFRPQLLQRGHRVQGCGGGAVWKWYAQ